MDQIMLIFLTFSFAANTLVIARQSNPQFNKTQFLQIFIDIN